MDERLATYRATVKRHNGGDIVEVWDNGHRLARRQIAAGGMRPEVLDLALLRLGYERVSATWRAGFGGALECRCQPLQATSAESAHDKF